VHASVAESQHAPVGTGEVAVGQNALTQLCTSSPNIVPVHAERATTVHVVLLPFTAQHTPHWAGQPSGWHTVLLPEYTPLSPPLLVVVHRSIGWIVHTGHTPPEEESM
jgi:hypothetical protein